MKLTQHQLKLYTDDDYRENVFKSCSIKLNNKTAEELLEELE